MLKFHTPTPQFLINHLFNATTEQSPHLTQTVAFIQHPVVNSSNFKDVLLSISSSRNIPFRRRRVHANRIGAASTNSLTSLRRSRPTINDNHHNNNNQTNNERSNQTKK
jgi:hypothetical protein